MDERVERLKERNRVFRLTGQCSFCRPHRGENKQVTRYKRNHGQKPKTRRRR